MIQDMYLNFSAAVSYRQCLTTKIKTEMNRPCFLKKNKTYMTYKLNLASKSSGETFNFNIKSNPQTNPFKWLLMCVFFTLLIPIFYQCCEITDGFTE